MEASQDLWMYIWEINQRVNAIVGNTPQVYENPDQIWANDEDPSIIKRNHLYIEKKVERHKIRMACAVTENDMYVSVLVIQTLEGALVLRTNRNNLNFLDVDSNIVRWQEADKNQWEAEIKAA